MPVANMNGGITVVPRSELGSETIRVRWGCDASSSLGLLERQGFAAGLDEDPANLREGGFQPCFASRDRRLELARRGRAFELCLDRHEHVLAVLQGDEL